MNRTHTGAFVTDELGVVRPVQRAFVSASATGDTAIVAARGAGIKIRVLAAYYVSTLANTVKFRSNTTDISPPTPLAANGGMVLPFSPIGWFQTAANEALNGNLSVATATGIMIEWVEAT